MKPQDVIDHFGSVKALEEVTGLTHQAIYYWKKVGRVPIAWQYRLQEMSKGKLKRGKAA